MSKTEQVKAMYSTADQVQTIRQQAALQEQLQTLAPELAALRQHLQQRQAPTPELADLRKRLSAIRAELLSLMHLQPTPPPRWQAWVILGGLGLNLLLLLALLLRVW